MPDKRDFQFSVSAHLERLRKLFAHRSGRSPSPEDVRTPSYIFSESKPPDKMDLVPRYDKRGWPVEDQGTLSSCTAHAVIGLVEYLVHQDLNQYLDLSRLFLYSATRRLLGWPGDSGAFIRNTIQAMSIFGVPPEKYWAYDLEHFYAEPDAFLFGYAASFKALEYYRLDGYSQDGAQTLDWLKRVLADGYPVGFGFPVYDCIVDTRPDIPIPAGRNVLLGGHAVLAVGYDDEHKDPDADPDADPDTGPKGAVRIRNSWGRTWGENGYGWLPYEYFTNQLASDLWTIFKQSWIDGEPFS